MTTLIPAVLVALLGGVGIRVWYRRWRTRRRASRRVVEKPNSHYASKLVRDIEEREDWEAIDMSRLHPLNRDEAERLLGVIEALGMNALSSKDRIFMENMRRVAQL